ncbi:MAG: lysylphosphatidylglycerol synthase domain-containing protein [Lachnospiraceae bacterium]
MASESDRTAGRKDRPADRKDRTAGRKDRPADRKDRPGLIIDIAAAAVSLFFFIRLFARVDLSDLRTAGRGLALVAVCAACVITVKLIRLYILMFGNEFSFWDFVLQFCKTASVNMLIPFKAGEIYRGYDLDRLIGSYPLGYVYAITDRFVDTAALLTIIVIFSLAGEIDVNSVYLLFAVIVFLVIFVYVIFKPFYTYWNHFLIYNKTSRHTLRGLELLDRAAKIYRQMSGILHGRIATLYALSLLAWIIEIAGLFRSSNHMVGQYLSDIIYGNLNYSNFLFVVNCLAFCLVLAAAAAIRKRRQS